jgi:hypothetical protein
MVGIAKAFEAEQLKVSSKCKSASSRGIREMRSLVDLARDRMGAFLAQAEGGQSECSERPVSWIAGRGGWELGAKGWRRWSCNLAREGASLRSAPLDGEIQADKSVWAT